jgi:hypothetical protein
MARERLVAVLVRSGLSEADARAIAEANAYSVFLLHDAGVLLEDTLSAKKEMVRSDVADYMSLDRAFPDDKAKRDEVGEKLLGFFFGVYEARADALNDKDVGGFVKLCKSHSPVFHLNGQSWKTLEFALLDANATSKKVRKAMQSAMRAMGVFPHEVREELDAMLAAARSRGDVAGLLEHVAELGEDQLLLTPAEAVVASGRSQHTAKSESAPSKRRRVNLFP